MSATRSLREQMVAWSAVVVVHYVGFTAMSILFG